jgi:cytochrome c5
VALNSKSLLLSALNTKFLQIMKYTILTVSIFLFSVACAVGKNKTNSSSVAKEMVPEDYVNKIATKYPGYTVEQFGEGKKIYEMHCGKCHDLPVPAKYSEEKWTKIVPGMTKAVNKKEALINDEQQDLILRYVVTVTTVANQ